MKSMDGQDILKISGGDKEYDYVLDRDDLTIGRGDDSTLILAQEIISRHHAKIERIKSVVYITDLGSRNGTKVNGTNIKPNEPHELANLDTITIGKFNLQLFLHLRPSEGEKLSVKKPSDETQHIPLLTERPCVTIGRSPDNDIKLDHPAVSRKHARIVRQGTKDEYIIEDLGSTNGTCVNGQRIVKSSVLHRDDIVNIGPYKLTYRAGKLESVDESRTLGLEAINLQKKVGKGKNLLQDISLSIKPGSFVAIVGMAGSGKSTLLDVLNGFRPATSGRVLVNGNDLYANYDVYRNQLGYVPQQNIVHMGLTAYEVLDYSARLRLPLDTTHDERHKRVISVLETLGIGHCKDQPVSRCSGGEKRRVAMGVELLAEPGLFFLDEVTSGLDPGTEHEIMRLLHKLSREGRTILLITHATKNVTECDMVVFLCRGGHLAYYGPPKEALTYFKVNDFDEIYEKLREGSPEQWGKDYRQSEQYHKYILDPLIGQSQTPQKTLPVKDTSKAGGKNRRTSALNQFFTLLSRNTKLLLHDKVSLMLMLLIAPLIGLLDFVFWKPGIFDASGGDATRAIINMFFAATVCFLVGGLATMREIAKEMDIYRRERMVCLKILPYVLSKLCFSIVISLYSAGIFTLFMLLAGHWPPGGDILVVYITMFLSVLAAMVTGLLISSISPNQNVSPLILLVFLVPQILFGGVLPEKYMSGVGPVLGAVTTTKWTYQALVTISDMGTCVADEQCRAEECSGPSLFTECNFPGVADFLDESPDQNSAMIAAEQNIDRMEEQYGSAFHVNIAFCWIILLMFITGFFSLILVVLRLKDRK